MGRRICLGLRDEERRELERLYRQTRDGAVKLRSLMVRLVDKGETAREVGDRLGVSPVTVWRWGQRYMLEGSAGLYTRPRKGRPAKLRPQDKELLLQVVEKSPRALGINATNWTTGLLAYYVERETGVKVSDEAIRRFLHRAGFKLKRPTPVVISPDPQYQEKRGSWKRWSSAT